LLADRVVELDYSVSIAQETIRRGLKAKSSHGSGKDG